MSGVWLSWSPAQLLWATRGLHWGFRMVVEPRVGNLESLALYEAVFSTSASLLAPEASMPDFFRARVTDPSGVEWHVVAARFLDPDPSHNDEAGRRILHEMLLVLGPDATPNIENALGDWHLRLFDQVRSEYERVYRLESSRDVEVHLESDATHVLLGDNEGARADWIDLGKRRVANRSHAHRGGRTTGSRQERKWLPYGLGGIFLVTLMAAAITSIVLRSEKLRDAPAVDRLAFEGKQYQFFGGPVAWKEAKRRCEDMGGHLACPESSKENQFLWQIGQKATLPNGRAAWIGVYRDGKDQQWKFVSGMPVTASGWDGAANEIVGDAAAQLDLTGGAPKWLVARRDDRGPFICEWTNSEGPVASGKR